MPSDAALVSLATFCPLCGGAQVIHNVGADAEQEVMPFQTKEKQVPEFMAFRKKKEKWWQFWK